MSLTVEQLAKVRHILSSSDVLKQLKKTFDYSFETEIGEVNGKLQIKFVGRDAGGEFMTLGDVSALLQMDRKAIRQLTEARAQRSTPNPIPFLKINKMLRFKRSAIIAWLEAKGAESAVLPPVKGKKRK